MSKSTEKRINKYVIFLRHWVGKSDWWTTVSVNVYEIIVWKERLGLSLMASNDSHHLN